MSPKFLIFDGHDRAGKSTSIRSVWLARNKIDICVDRHILTNLVYNEKYNRPLSSESYLSLIPTKSKNVAIIFLYCDSLAILKKRFVESNEVVPSDNELETDTKLFKKWFTWLRRKLIDSKIQFISIDTSYLTKKQVTEKIVEALV